MSEKTGISQKSNDKIKKVKCIQFGLLSPEKIVRILKYNF